MLLDAASKGTSNVISKSSLPENLFVRKKLRNPLYVGKHDYTARKAEDLSFKKGDLLYIIDSRSEFCKLGWWFARAKHSGQEGYIPWNSVREYNSKLDMEP